MNWLRFKYHRVSVQETGLMSMNNGLNYPVLMGASISICLGRVSIVK